MLRGQEDRCVEQQRCSHTAVLLCGQVAQVPQALCQEYSGAHMGRACSRGERWERDCQCCRQGLVDKGSWQVHASKSLECQLLATLLNQTHTSKLSEFLKLRKYTMKVGGGSMLDDISLYHEDVIGILHNVYKTAQIKKTITKGIKKLFISYKMASPKYFTPNLGSIHVFLFNMLCHFMMISTSRNINKPNSQKNTLKSMKIIPFFSLPSMKIMGCIGRQAQLGLLKLKCIKLLRGGLWKITSKTSLIFNQILLHRKLFINQISPNKLPSLKYYKFDKFMKLGAKILDWEIFLLLDILAVIFMNKHLIVHQIKKERSTLLKGAHSLNSIELKRLNNLQNRIKWGMKNKEDIKRGQKWLIVIVNSRKECLKVELAKKKRNPLISLMKVLLNNAGSGAELFLSFKILFLLLLSIY